MENCGKNINARPSCLFHSPGYDMWKEGNGLWDFFWSEYKERSTRLKNIKLGDCAVPLPSCSTGQNT